MTKNKYIQIRVNSDEERWIDELAKDYDLDRSKLIIFSLDYIRENRPEFTIKPQGKESTPVGALA